MAKKTVRKLVTMPLDTAERVEQFRMRTGASSESDALKTLIEGGLSRYDTRGDLLQRCRTATENGQSIGDLINAVVADHPLVKRTSVDGASLRIYLRPEFEDDSEYRLRFFRVSKTWIEEFRPKGSEHEWTKVAPPRPASRAGKAELDDDIPF